MNSIKRIGAQLASCALLTILSQGVAGGHELPYPVSATAYTVTQGNNTGSHTGIEAWAYDFGIGVGKPIVASDSGTVKLVKQNSDQYGCFASYGNDGNYVVVDHGNGQSSLYLHLKQNSVVVAKGDNVVKGQKLGEVGNSGWICGTHLHYQLFKSCTSWYCQSVPVLFAPRLRSPAQGTKATSTSVKFVWESIPYASVYRLVVSQYADFRGYNDTTRTCDGTCFTTSTSSTTYTKTLNNVNFKYYVRIRSSDDTGARPVSPWSNAWFLTP